MNTVFVGVHGNVLALEKLSGAFVWQTYLDGGFGESFISLTADGELVFAHTRSKLFCLEAGSGRILWMNNLPGMGYGIASICALAGTPESLAALEVQQKTGAGS